MRPADFVVEKMRILGLDFGSRTVGVAVSDELLLTAQGLETIERKDENKLRKTCARIEEIIKEYGVEEIVLGLPKNMNNTEGDRVEKTKEFKEMLERRTGLLVTLWDERLTTVAAEKVLMESGVRRENRKAVIDKVAACLILQGYPGSPMADRYEIGEKKWRKKITLVDDEQTLEFYVLEETKLNGSDYLLVTDAEDEEEEADCYILKDMSREGEADALYEFVEDEAELEGLMKIFEELLDDVDIETKE